MMLTPQWRRMLKKAVQQGRSERRGEEVRTTLRVAVCLSQKFLANGKAPHVFPISEVCLSGEPLSDARTLLADFFSILLEVQHWKFRQRCLADTR